MRLHSFSCRHNRDRWWWPRGKLCTHWTYMCLSWSSILWYQHKLGGIQAHNGTHRLHVHSPAASAGAWLRGHKIGDPCMQYSPGASAFRMTWTTMPERHRTRPTEWHEWLAE